MKTRIVVDPPGCRCTDCLTGYSVPFDWLSKEQMSAPWEVR